MSCGNAALPLVDSSHSRQWTVCGVRGQRDTRCHSVPQLQSCRELRKHTFPQVDSSQACQRGLARSLRLPVARPSTGQGARPSRPVRAHTAAQRYASAGRLDAPYQHATRANSAQATRCQALASDRYRTVTRCQRSPKPVTTRPHSVTVHNSPLAKRQATPRHQSNRPQSTPTQDTHDRPQRTSTRDSSRTGRPHRTRHIGQSKKDCAQ